MIRVDISPYYLEKMVLTVGSTLIIILFQPHHRPGTIRSMTYAPMNFIAGDPSFTRI